MTQSIHVDERLSLKQLLAITLASVLAGALLCVFVIFPAEYDLDITGVGKQLGLTEVANPNATEVYSIGSQSILKTELVIPVGEGIEYKVFAQEGAKINYEWVAVGELYADVHGEPQGDDSGYYESYVRAKTEEMAGKILAPFAGTHGWYWENNTREHVSLALEVSGEFEAMP